MSSGEALVAGLRAHAVVGFRHRAVHLQQVAAITALVHAQEGWRVGQQARGEVPGGGRFSEHDLDVLAATEVAAAVGCSRFEAERDVEQARALTGVLSSTLAALEEGRIDGRRAATLVEETADLPRAQALEVESAVLESLPTEPLDGSGPVGPWDGRSPKAFTAHVRRVVAAVRTDHEEHVRREVRKRTEVSTWVHPDNPALATMTLTGPTETVLSVASTVLGRVRAMTSAELAGRTRGMAAVDLVHDAVCGGTPVVGGGGRELGVVLTMDTVTGADGSTAAAGEVRGAGVPVPVGAAVARVLGRQATERRAHTSVLLTDRAGRLLRLLQVGRAPANGWSRTSLVAAARRALGRQPPDMTDAYAPNAHIARTVRARDAVCTFPGCAVPSSRCDLDHTVPHPRGPTAVHNLSPRSRRCHRYKSAALWRCRTRRDRSGAVTAHEWTSPLGTRQLVQVEPLPTR